MKIKSPSEIFRSVERVNQKQERSSQNDSHQSGQNTEKEPTFKVTDETVDQAIDSFSKDEAAVSHGLHAIALGTGPGLKVILHDKQGAVVRQLTGEEFVKLREKVSKSSAKTGSKPGKILDQKG